MTYFEFIFQVYEIKMEHCSKKLDKLLKQW